MLTQRQPSYYFKKILNENNEKSISIFKTRKKYELRFIAVKMYNKRRHKDYNKEYEILKEIDNPSIIKVYGYSEDRNYFYMEMEYCLITLFEICSKNQLNKFYEKVIKSISTQILLGLKELHNKGIIHCNIKPKNILVDEFGKIRICDLRKALIVKEMTIEEIKKNKSVITPCYTAPEIMNNNGIYSFKSDLYSLGCIMYELATGFVPFFDKDINTLIKKIINGHYNKKPLLVYSIEFSNIVNSLLEKDPNKRPGWGEIEKFPFWDLEDNNNINNNINCNNNFHVNINNNINGGLKYNFVHLNHEHDNHNRPQSSTYSYHRPNSTSNITNNTIKIERNKFESKTHSINLINNNHNNILLNNNKKKEVNSIIILNEEEESYSNTKNIHNVDTPDKEFNIYNNKSEQNNEEENEEMKKLQQLRSPITNSLSISLINLSEKKTDKRDTNNSIVDMKMSLANPDEIPQINTIMIHNSDKIVKPIISNKIIEPIIITNYNIKLIEFSPVLKIEKLKELLINDYTSQLGNYLSTIYDYMNIYYQQKKYDLLLNLLNYFETIILSRDISNQIISSQFIDLFMRLLNIRNENIQLRVCSILGFLIRYATETQSSFEKYNFTEILISFISDNNLDLNRKAIATLGEYLFFISTQIEEELDIIHDEFKSQWNINKNSILTLLFALNHSDEKVRFYSLKTIENICIKCTIAKKFFASNDDFILKIINIYNDNCENIEIKTSALNTCSHLIKLESNLFKVFINKIDSINILLEKENEKNQQCLINCLLFSFANNINNVKEINLMEVIPILIKLLENGNKVIKSKIILLFSLILNDCSLILNFGEKIFEIMQNLRKEKELFYFYVKVFEGFMINYCLLMDKYFILNFSNDKNIRENTNDIYILIKSFNIISPYHKISYSLFKEEFLETSLRILEFSITFNNLDLVNECLNLFLNFSEHSFSVEQNCDLLINKLYKQILLLTPKLNPDFKRYPLNICANILYVFLEDDKLYSINSFEELKTNEINSLVYNNLPIIFDLLKNQETTSECLLFLSLIIEKYSFFLKFYRSLGIIDYIFLLLKDENYYSNLNLLKIMIKLTETPETKFQDILELQLIDKINYLISKDNIDDVSIYTEYVIEMYYGLMYKIHEARKKIQNNENKIFMSKIEKTAINFKLCIKLLTCDNINVQEKSCICLIFLIKFFPNERIENLNINIKFTNEDIPYLIKALGGNFKKIHKKMIKIFKWIIEYQKDAKELLCNYISYIQIYIEKIRDTSEEPESITLASKFLGNDLPKLNIK